MLLIKKIKRTSTLFTIALLLSLSLSGHAVVEQGLVFDSPKTEKRYKKLITELRCLVCQNQNLADSDAELAKDLRRKTVEMLQNGASNKEVKNYMRERYGDFVLYEPPFNVSTAFLWLGPFFVLLIVLIGLIINLRQRQQDALIKPAHSENQQTRIKVQNLLKDSPDIGNTKQSK